TSHITLKQIKHDNNFTKLQITLHKTENKNTPKLSMTESEAWRVCRFADKRTAELIHPKRAEISRTANWPDGVWLFCRRNSIDGVERIFAEGNRRGSG